MCQTVMLLCAKMPECTGGVGERQGEKLLRRHLVADSQI